MKYGKIYTYENRNEAEVGKEYVFSDVYMYVCAGTDLTSELCAVLKAVHDGSYPFETEVGTYFQFIREVIEEPPVLMTNRQLAEWLAKGNGEMSLKKGMGIGAYARHEYEKKKANDSVPDDILIRPWDSDEWVVPSVDIYERDCR